MIAAVAFGLVLGAATGIPLGVVNVAVVEAATRLGRRAGVAIGAGGALADGVHAALAFAGLGALITRYPHVRQILLGVSAAVVVAYAVYVWRKPVLTAPATPSAPHPRHFLLGLSLTLPNPAAFGAWIAVAGMVPSHTLAAAIGAAGGVAIGSAAWFAALAHLAARRALQGDAARRVSRLLALALVSLSAFAILREWL